MPIGGFLDTMPTVLFVMVHILFLVVGVWIVKKAKDYKLIYASAFLLYVLSQVGFLASFGGFMTLKMAVLLEQTLVFIMLVWIITKVKQTD